MAHVELRNINKKFRRHTALDDLSLDVGDGEFFVLLGPTGAGKTTTLRLIAGLDAPDSGSSLIEGADVGQWSAADSAALHCPTSAPSIRIEPESGASRPAISRRVVVLPAPVGPSRTKNSPSPTSRLRSSSAVWRRNFLLMLRSSTWAMAAYSLIRSDSPVRRSKKW